MRRARSNIDAVRHVDAVSTGALPGKIDYIETNIFYRRDRSEDE